jgi:hypothetical protein
MYKIAAALDEPGARKQPPHQGQPARNRRRRAAGLDVFYKNNKR